MRRLGTTFGLASATQYLIVITVLVYAFQILNQPRTGGDLLSTLSIRYPSWVEVNFALITPPGVPEFHVWQLVTYMFLHGAWWHILFNMYVLWIFGHVLERVWGSRRFLVYYFFTGVGAGLTTVAAAMLLDGGLSINLGASGAIMGLLLAFALIFPEQPLYFFLIPVAIPAKYAVIGIAALSVFFSITGAFPGIGHITHLGGLVFGFLYMKGRGWARRLLG